MLLLYVYKLCYLQQFGKSPPRKVNLRSQSQKMVDLNQKSKLMSEIFHNP